MEKHRKNSNENFNFKDNLCELSPKQSVELDSTADFLSGLENLDFTVQNTLDISSNYFCDPFNYDNLFASNRLNIQNDISKENPKTKPDSEPPKSEQNNMQQDNKAIDTVNNIDTNNKSDNKIEESSDLIKLTSTKSKPIQVVSPVGASDKPPKLLLGKVKPDENILSVVNSNIPTDNLISLTGYRPIPVFYSPPHRKPKRRLSSSLQGILQKQNDDVKKLQQENNKLKFEIEKSEKQHLLDIENAQLLIDKLKNQKMALVESTSDIKQRIVEESLNNKKLSSVVEQYECSFSDLISEQELEKKQFEDKENKLRQEYKDALCQLDAMEVSFTDLLTKYDKCKAVMQEQNEREKILLAGISQHKEAVIKYKTLYNKLKQVTSNELAKSDEVLSEVNTNHSMEITKLNAIIKKYDIEIASLQELLNLKVKDNEKLSAIYERLISKLK